MHSLCCISAYFHALFYWFVLFLFANLILCKDGEKHQQNPSEHSGEKMENNKKVYFEQELKRLRASLQREGSKIKKPQR